MAVMLGTSIAVLIIITIRIFLTIGQLCHRRGRGRAYAATRNTGSHDYHEKSN